MSDDVQELAQAIAKAIATVERLEAHVTGP